MIKTVIKCSSPSSIAVSVSSAIAGTACASLVGDVHILIATFCVLFCACFQMSANLLYCYFLGVNDRKDFTDVLLAPGDKHTLPLLKVLRGAATMLAAIGAMIGMALMVSGGWLVIFIGLIVLGLSYLIMGGSRVMSSYPVKMIFDFLIMGPGVVMLTAYVQIMHDSDVNNVGMVMLPSAIMGVIMGLYAVGCITAHGYMCVDHDREFGKRTFTLKYGRKATMIYMCCSLLVTTILTEALLWIVGVDDTWALIAIPAVFLIAKVVILWAMPRLSPDMWVRPQNWIMITMVAYSIVMLLAFTVIDPPRELMLVLKL